MSNYILFDLSLIIFMVATAPTQYNLTKTMELNSRKCFFNTNLLYHLLEYVNMNAVHFRINYNNGLIYILNILKFKMTEYIT